MVTLPGTYCEAKGGHGESGVCVLDAQNDDGDDNDDE